MAAQCYADHPVGGIRHFAKFKSKPQPIAPSMHSPSLTHLLHLANVGPPVVYIEAESPGQ